MHCNKPEVKETHNMFAQLIRQSQAGRSSLKCISTICTVCVHFFVCVHKQLEWIYLQYVHVHSRLYLPPWWEMMSTFIRLQAIRYWSASLCIIHYEPLIPPLNHISTTHRCIIVRITSAGDDTHHNTSLKQSRECYLWDDFFPGGICVYISPFSHLPRH